MKYLIRRFAAMILAVWLIPAQAGEVLGHMSDESAPAVVEPANPAPDDRRIIYRVICSPEGEVLPDCEKPYHDTESVAKPARQQVVAEPATDEQVSPLEEVVQPTAVKKSKKTVGKTQKAGKKTKKNTSSKKTAAKKK